MNPLDRWREILEVLLRRKLRAALTSLAVAWGIFMLVVLLAAGNGLSSGAQQAFGRDAKNAVWLSPGMTAKPWAGLPVGRRIQIDDADLGLVRNRTPYVDRSSGEASPGNRPVGRGSRQGTFNVRGVQPDHERIENSEITSGRYLDADDVAGRRKVAVIGKKVRQALFRPEDNPLGGEIRIGAAVFQVIGVFAEAGEEREEQNIYIPISTARATFALGPRLGEIAFTLDSPSLAVSEPVLDGLRRTLAARKAFAPDDKRAVWMWNNQEMFDKLTGLFRGIRAFVWLIGLGTILAGMVGVSNIMLISVAERTREIGVRKALGAAPASIVRMIVEEALVVTMVSGYLGLCAAVAVVNLVAAVLPPGTPYFDRPEVDLGVGLAATLVLVLAGTLAGLFPALRAARINPIAALRVE